MTTQDPESKSPPALLPAGLAILALLTGVWLWLRPVEEPHQPALSAPQVQRPVPAAAGNLRAEDGQSVPAAEPAEPARVEVSNGLVVFHFAPGSTVLPADAALALADVVKGVATGQKAVVSAYVSAAGDQAQAELQAGERALVVRDLLTSLGIGEDKIVVHRPQADATIAEGSPESRRVVLSLE